MGIETAQGHDAANNAAGHPIVRTGRTWARSRASQGLAEVLVWTSGWETEHRRHVASLALELFVDLGAAHQLDGEARMLLECALLVQAQAATFPHRVELPRALDRRQSAIVACITSYLGEWSPDLSDDVYRLLEPVDRRVVRWCAAIMRTAEAYDITHRGAVRSLLGLCEEDKLVIVAGCGERSNADVEAGHNAARALAREADLGLRCVEVMMPGVE